LRVGDALLQRWNLATLGTDKLLTHNGGVPTLAPMDAARLYQLLETAQRVVNPAGDAEFFSCFFRFRTPDGHVNVTSFETERQAADSFARTGGWFTAPAFHVRLQRSDRPLAASTPPVPRQAIESTERIDAGDEAFLWRGYDGNSRGVVKMRVGRYQADVNMPSAAEAQGMARHLAAVLRP
jgi:hypothetical protein